MAESDVFTIHTDGAARGNPGPAAYSYVIERPGLPDIEVKERLGETTNNIAEYTALVQALEHAGTLGGKHLDIRSDSDLMVQQMNGTYRVKHEGLRPLYEKARQLCRRFDSVNIRHVRREENTRADRLCNEALDGKASGVKRKAKPKGVSPERAERVREDAVQCLRTMASAWARGNPREPRPEDVWEQLWSILEDAGVLR
jgi:ribonuclease HI